MGMAEISTWSIDHIQCSRWKESNDTANIQISNYAGDSISFQAVRHPDGFLIAFDASPDFRSEDWYLYTSEADAIESQCIQIELELNQWQANIDIAKEWVVPDNWFVRKGQKVNDEIWAGLAYLFELRASMFEAKIIEALALDMKVDVALAKERIRKLRDKGFLSLAGKGNSTEGRITKSAMQVLIERGLMNAKES
jgi:hypothetical protein